MTTKVMASEGHFYLINLDFNLHVCDTCPNVRHNGLTIWWQQLIQFNSFYMVLLTMENVTQQFYRNI